MEETRQTKALLREEAEVANLLQDQQLSKIEHEQAIQTMQDEMEKQRTDFESQHQNMTELYQDEKAELIDTLQSQIDAKSTTIQNLTSEMDQLETFIQECKEGTQAIENTYQESLKTNSQLQHEKNELCSSHQIAQEGSKAANYLFEKENDDLAEELNGTKVQLADTNEKLSSVQTEYTTLSQEHMSLQQQLDGTKGQLVDTSKKISVFLAKHTALQTEHAELAEELDGTKVTLANTSELMSGVQTEYNMLSQEHMSLQLDLDGTIGQLADTSEKLSGVHAENETLQTEHAKLAEELDVTKAQLMDTNEKMSGVQTECATLSQEHMSLQQQLDGTIGQFANTSEKFSVIQADHATLQTDYASLQQENSGLAEELDGTKAQLTDTNEELSSFRTECKTMLQEHMSLQRELDDTQGRLADTSKKLSGIQTQYVTMQTEYDSLQRDNSQLEQAVSTLEGQMERTTVDHEEELLQKSQRMSATEHIWNEEKSASNRLRTRLRELNFQVKEDGAARQKELRKLERELESVREDLSIKDNEARFQVDATHHATEMESLRTEHAAQVMVIGTRGADVVSDLEDVIVELEKEIAGNKLEHEEAVNNMHQEMQTAVANVDAEKEYMKRSLAEQQRKGMGREEKITSLAMYVKERKEEVKIVKNELARVKHTLQNNTREREDAVTAIQNELQNARVLHEQEMSDLQHIVDDVRSELSVTKERLASEDGELDRAKATLSERTNLLRDMVNQTTAYQGDYEREHTRANQLDEAVESYKNQLAEARGMAQRLEHEIHDKDTHYCDAILNLNERQQRKAMESELESSQKSMEDALRKNADIEKEKSTLKDKVSRQEKYIGRLQDRDKQNRRTSTMPTTTSQGNHRGITSKIARPSTAGASRSPVRITKERVTNKHRSGYYAADENDRPNIGRM